MVASTSSRLTARPPARLDDARELVEQLGIDRRHRIDQRGQSGPWGAAQDRVQQLRHVTQISKQAGAEVCGGRHPASPLIGLGAQVCGADHSGYGAMDVAPVGACTGGAFKEGGDGLVGACRGVGEVPRLAGRSGWCDLGELEIVGGIRGRFPADGGVADLGEAAAAIPAQLDAGYTTICFKPSQFTDDPAEVGWLCRQLVGSFAG